MTTAEIEKMLLGFLIIAVLSGVAGAYFHAQINPPRKNPYTSIDAAEMEKRHMREINSLKLRIARLEAGIKQ